MIHQIKVDPQLILHIIYVVQLLNMPELQLKLKVTKQKEN